MSTISSGRFCARRSRTRRSLARVQVRTGTLPETVDPPDVAASAVKQPADGSRWITRPLLPHHDYGSRHTPRPRLRVRREPGLLLQVPGRQLGAEGAGHAPAALGPGAVLLEVVHARHDHRHRELGPARGGAGDGADVGDPGLARRRRGVHRRDGRQAVRLRGRSPPVARPVPDGRRAGAAGRDAAGDARRALALLAGRR